MKYQVTLFSRKGNAPVSCIVEMPAGMLEGGDNRKALIKKGTEKICMRRLWSKNDILRYGYLHAKIREYDAGGVQ